MIHRHVAFYLHHVKDDIPAGIVVFLVALPLFLGIALASDAPLFSGLIGGLIIHRSSPIRFSICFFTILMNYFNRLKAGNSMRLSGILF